LFQDDTEAEYDEDYAAYLDKLACSEDDTDSKFLPPKPTTINEELGMDES